MGSDPRKLPEHVHDSADDGENIHRRPEDATPDAPADEDAQAATVDDG